MGLALCKSLFTVGSQVTPDAGLWLALLGGGAGGKVRQHWGTGAAGTGSSPWDSTLSLGLVPGIQVCGKEGRGTLAHSAYDGLCSQASPRLALQEILGDS